MHVLTTAPRSPHTCIRYDETSPAPPCMHVLTTAPRSPHRYDETSPALSATTPGGSPAHLSFVPRPGVEYLLSVCAVPARDADFTPLPWGTPPATQPHFSRCYVVGLQGCAPHPSIVVSSSGAAWQLPEGVAPLCPTPNGWLSVPTGLDGLQPERRLSGGGASLFAQRDLRSGNPQEVNTVHLTRASLAAKGCMLRSVRMSYRYVIGYSGVSGDPGPSFTLELVDGGGGEIANGTSCGAFCSHGRAFLDASARGCVLAASSPLPGCIECDAEEAAAAEEPTVHVLYQSPEFDAVPYSWDTGTGGSPTNYSPRIDIEGACAVGPLRGSRQTLRIVFRNGRRNMHLQGGGWPEEGSCELRLQLHLERSIS